MASLSKVVDLAASYLKTIYLLFMIVTLSLNVKSSSVIHDNTCKINLAIIV